MNKLLNRICSPHVVIHSITQDDKQITTLLTAYTDNYNADKSNTNKVIISDPVFMKTPNGIQINLFYFEGRKNEFSTKFASSKIADLISKCYNQNVSFYFTKVHYPYINACIFAQFLFHNSPANTFMHFQNAVLKYLSWHGRELISHVEGVKVEISGRIITEKVIPRVTKKSIVFGSLSNCEYIDYSKYTGKNFIGSITVKVWIAIKTL